MSHPTRSDIDVSVIICTRDRPDQIGRAVASVLANSYRRFELLVVDQSSDRSTECVLSAYRGDARLRYLTTESRGLSKARNVGLKNTTGALVAFTDDDCLASADWIGKLVQCFDAHANAHVIFGQVDAPSWYRPSGGFLPVYRPNKDEDSSCNGRRFARGMGANMSLRRTVIGEIGYFDEVLGAGAPLMSAEDCDFAIRATAAGRGVLGFRSPVVIHEGGMRGDADAYALWYRDGFGAGAAAAKCVKCGLWFGAGSLLSPTLEIFPQVVRSVLGWSPGHPFHVKPFVYHTWGTICGLRAGLSWPVGRRGRAYLFG